MEIEWRKERIFYGYGMEISFYDYLQGSLVFLLFIGVKA